MTKKKLADYCTSIQLNFPGFKRRKVQASFSGGHVSSDAGGCLLLRQVDSHSGLLKQVSPSLTDFRRKKSCAHDLTSLLRQRVYGLALGYEDVNDHDPLRHDLALQTANEFSLSFPLAFILHLKNHVQQKRVVRSP